MPWNALAVVAFAVANVTAATHLKVAPVFGIIVGLVLVGWVTVGSTDERERRITQQGGAIAAVLLFGAAWTYFAWPGNPGRIPRGPR